MSNLRNFELNDINLLKKVSGPKISPDGTRIVFSVKETHYMDNKYTTQIFMVDLNGNITKLTDNKDARAPIWSPDGEEIAFLSGNSIQRLKPRKPPQKIIDIESVTSPLIWSPDEKKILFTSRVSSGPKAETDVLVIDRLPYKFNGLGFLRDRWNHAFILDLNTKRLTQVTNGKYNVSQPKWDPTGLQIAYLANKTIDAEISSKNDIWVTDIETGIHKKLTDGKFAYYNISFSPDKKWIAARGNNRKYGLATKNDIHIINLNTGESRNLTSKFISKIGDSVSGGTGFDYVSDLVWSIDSKNIYFLNAMKGNNNLYKVSIKNGEVKQILDSSKSIQSFSFSRSQEVLSFLATDMINPSEIWLSYKGIVKKLTNFNDQIIGGLRISGGEKFTFNSSDGVPVECWYYSATGFGSDKRPLVLLIKGGPHMACWGNAFYFNVQLLLSNGYDVLLTNERGTGGYGEDFAKTARAKFYGQREFQDIMEVLDYVIESYPVDPNRLNVMGYSRGGFLTNWIITHTDRFNSAITAGGFCDVYSFFSTGDYMHVWCEKNYEGTPWDDEELYMTKSPIRYVKNITTPTLIMHAMQDYRASVTQAEQLFVSLRRLRKDVEMVLFPDENHSLPRNSSPNHLTEYYRHMLRWFDKYNK
jgi:dipeptidyl aminopeptidase/acylaminoacyl peptidase